LTVRRGETGFSTLLETAPLVAQSRLGSGTIRSSLWAATDDARLPDAVASQLIEIFSTDVDFHRELRRGDTFSVVFEALTADDQPITWNDATGRILAAEFINHGRQLQAVWFHDANKGKGAYFAPDGKSRQRAFLASPLAFSRITSGFAERFHPILQSWRAHNGVDYSAPTGTPVRAVGDGVVDLANRQNGYGNVVQVQHPSQEQGAHIGHSGPDRVSLLAKNIPKGGGAALRHGLVQLPFFQNTSDFVAQVACLADADQIAFDVGHKDGHALIGEVFRQILQTDRFAGACCSGNQAVAVGHAHQNVTICGLIAGNQELIWHEKGSPQLEK
jgi:hypothetical protein